MFNNTRSNNGIYFIFVGFARITRLCCSFALYDNPLIFGKISSGPRCEVVTTRFAGYVFDENDRDSSILRLQFARFPGPRSSGGPRGRR